jgi:hypothetical protein
MFWTFTVHVQMIPDDKYLNVGKCDEVDQMHFRGKKQAKWKPQMFIPRKDFSGGKLPVEEVE